MLKLLTFVEAIAGTLRTREDGQTMAESALSSPSSCSR